MPSKRPVSFDVAARGTIYWSLFKARETIILGRREIGVRLCKNVNSFVFGPLYVCSVNTLTKLQNYGRSMKVIIFIIIGNK